MPIENRPDSQPNQTERMQVLYSKIDNFLHDEGPPVFYEIILEKIQRFNPSLRRKARTLPDYASVVEDEVKLRGLSSLSIRELDESYLRLKEVIAKNRLFDQEAEIDVGISTKLFYIGNAVRTFLLINTTPRDIFIYFYKKQGRGERIMEEKGFMERALLALEVQMWISDQIDQKLQTPISPTP